MTVPWVYGGVEGTKSDLVWILYTDTKSGTLVYLLVKAQRGEMQDTWIGLSDFSH